METTPCDKFEYNSNEYDECIKDIVYEQAQDEWIMLDPRFPNLKGITPKRIDEFLANAETQGMKKYFEDYLQHVMVYDRDDIVSMCYDLGQQIEEKYPDDLHSPHSIFVTTPRGGHEVLSIFAYTNNLKKEQIPSHIKGIDEDEYRIAKKDIEREKTGYKEKYDENEDNEDEYVEPYYPFEEEEELPYFVDKQDVINHYNEGNRPIIPDIWLSTDTFYEQNFILRVFIIDDIIASADQMSTACAKIERFFRNTKIPVHIIPVVLVKRKDIEKKFSTLEDVIFINETIEIDKWNKAQSFIEDQRMGYITPKPKLIEDFDKLISVRFPWGSPDGESDKILTTLYESRRGLERIERKQRRCILEPDKCELK